MNHFKDERQVPKIIPNDVLAYTYLPEEEQMIARTIAKRLSGQISEKEYQDFLRALSDAEKNKKKL